VPLRLVVDASAAAKRPAPRIRPAAQGLPPNFMTGGEFILEQALSKPRRRRSEMLGGQGQERLGAALQLGQVG
jgi:hypothetical protein